MTDPQTTQRWHYNEADILTLWDENAFAYTITDDDRTNVGVYVLCSAEIEMRQGCEAVRNRARLVAEAPTMYAALEALADSVASIDPESIELMDDSFVEALGRYHDEARAVLSRVRGEVSDE